MTPQQKLTNAYNEFVRDYVEAHGENQATRDEAHERATKLTNLGRDVVAFCREHGIETDPYDMLEDKVVLSADEAYLVACAVAVALEEVK